VVVTVQVTFGIVARGTVPVRRGDVGATSPFLFYPSLILLTLHTETFDAVWVGRDHGEICTEIWLYQGVPARIVKMHREWEEIVHSNQINKMKDRAQNFLKLLSAFQMLRKRRISNCFP
jgi:hypothetical protein